MGHAPLRNGISQVEAALTNKDGGRSRKAIMVMQKRSFENNLFRMEIPIKACC